MFLPMFMFRGCHIFCGGACICADGGLLLVELFSESLVSAVLHEYSLLIRDSCIATYPAAASTASTASAGGLKESSLLLLHSLLRVGGRRLPLLRGGRRSPVHVPPHVHVPGMPHFLRRRLHLRGRRLLHLQHICFRTS